MRWLAALVVTLVLLLHVEPARAQDDAAATFAAAKKLYEAKSYAKALPLFLDAFKQSKSPNARLFIARSLRELGRRAEAYEEMRATVRDANEWAAKDPKYNATRDSAAAEVALLEAEVGKLIVAIVDPPEQLEVDVNGAALDRAALGTPRAVEPGKVTVAVRAIGKKPVSREIDVPKGETRTVTLALESDDARGGQAIPSSTAQPTASTAGASADEGFTIDGVRAAGIAVAALGAGGMIAFAVTGVMAKSEYDDLEAECGGQRCPDELADRVSKGRTLSTAANVSVAIGGAALVAGTVMIIVGGPSPEPSSSARRGSVPSVAFGAAPTLAGAELRARVRF